jgi:hypothetical protein
MANARSRATTTSCLNVEKWAAPVEEMLGVMRCSIANTALVTRAVFAFSIPSHACRQEVRTSSSTSSARSPCPNARA